MKKIFLSIIIISILLITCVTVNAETITVNKNEGNKINLVNLANKTNYLYKITDDYALFTFNDDVIKITKNNPFIEINNEKILISTENMNGVTLPKYDSIDISRNSVEVNFDSFVTWIDIEHDDKSVSIENKDVEIEEPTEEIVDSLEWDYIGKKLTDIGYNENGKYYLNEELMNEIKIGKSKITMTVYEETEFQKVNFQMNDLIVETILEVCVGNEYESCYRKWVEGNNFEMEVNGVKVKVVVSENKSVLELSKK